MKKIINSKIFKLSLVLFGLGFIFGILFLVITNKIDKLLITSEITTYFDNINNLNLFTSIYNNSIYIVIITISSLVFILSPMVLFINFYKGMTLSFFISSIIYTFKINGVLYALISVFPHKVLLSLLYIIYSTIMLSLSIKLFKCTKEKKSISINVLVKKVSLIFIISLLSTIILSLIEVYINPLLVNLVFN